MPARLGDVFELFVAAMLVALGARALLVAKRGDHVHSSRAHGARRPLLVGLVHGLAGSGALAAMVMSELPTALEGFLFMALYGAGATCGMAALAGLAGVPLARVAHKPRVVPVLVGATGVFSLGLGVWWAAPIVARLAAG